jgi:potassium-transporting ATPase KdpC subunit
MKKNLVTSVLMTIATTVLLGIIYPLVVTGLAQVLFPKKANGQLVEVKGKVIGSRIIGQAFTGRGYFHPRPSAVSYDAANSNGSQWGPTNQKLIDRVKGDLANITPANAEFQLPRVAKQRGTTMEQMRSLLAKHTEQRQFGFLGEPRVNVLEMNLELDEQFPSKKLAKIQ